MDFHRDRQGIDLLGFDEGLPEEDQGEDLDDAETEDLIHVPHKNELGLGAGLVMRFAREVMPRDYERISGIFARSGAYRRFRDLLVDRNMTQRWYDFEQAVMKEALEDWCKAEGIVLVDDEPGAVPA